MRPTRRQSSCIHLLFIILTFCELRSTARSPERLPEASSTALKMHRIYLQQPPHDRSLYDRLHVSPNATAADIDRAYRRLCLRLHPDKQRGDRGEHARHELALVRHAYDILQSDATRLPYHRYGLTDMASAVILLTGNMQGTAVGTGVKDLLGLMGYDPSSPRATHEERVRRMASRLLEQLRPVVEGSLTLPVLLSVVAEDCDRLKRLPMGAHILRCLGRAYRYSGQKVLNESKVDFGKHVRGKWRSVQHFVSALVASGRVVAEEKRITVAKRNSDPAIEYNDAFGELGSSDSDEDLAPLDDADMKHQAIRQAQSVLLESLQVEALWKISKIEIDRTAREACQLILNGDFFFFPSHQSSLPLAWSRRSDGWVGKGGQAIDAREGRRRAAEALVGIGNTMVQLSKEDTSWME